MDKKIIQNYIVDNTKEITDSGFKILIDKDGFDFIQLDNLFTPSLCFSLSKKKWNDNFLTISNFYPFLSYPIVDNIVIPILHKNGLFGSKTPLKQVLKEARITFEAPEKIKIPFPQGESSGKMIETHKDLEEVISIFKEIFWDESLPFFAKWNSVQKVYDYIMTIDDVEKSGLGMYGLYKKVVIMRLCNDPNYKKEFEPYYLERKMYFELYPIEAADAYNAARELWELLDSIEPIYNLKE